jgi:hypothetical protein
MTDEDRIKIQQTMQELAAQVLRQEQTAPGAQDADLVHWAKNKLSGSDAAPVPVPPTPVPTPPPAPPAQMVEPTVPAPAAPIGTTAQDDEDEGVLHIQRPGQTFQPGSNPTDGGSASNNSQGNGEQ